MEIGLVLGYYIRVQKLASSKPTVSINIKNNKYISIMKDRGRVKIYGNILSFTMGP
jgi:hypothetical protein